MGKLLRNSKHALLVGAVLIGSLGAGSIARASNWVISDIDLKVDLVTDGAVSKVVKSPLFGSGGPQDIAVSNSLGSAYVVGTYLGQDVPPFTVPIVIIDMSSGKATALVADPLAISHQPFSWFAGLASSPDGTRVYYASPDPTGTTSYFGTIETAGNSVVSEIELPDTTYPYHNDYSTFLKPTVSPDGKLAYVVGNSTSVLNDSANNQSYHPANLSIVSLDSMTVVTTMALPTGAAASFPVVTNDGKKLYLIVLDPPATGPGPPLPLHIYFHVLVVDTTTLDVRSIADFDNQTPQDGAAQGLAIAGNKVYVSHGAGGSCSNPNVSNASVLVIDTATDTATGTIPVPWTPNPAIGADLDGSQVYVSYQVHDINDSQYPCTQGHTALGIIDTATDTLVGAVSDPHEVLGWAKVAIDPIRPLHDPLRCVAGKRRAAGSTINKKLACFAKAMKTGTIADADPKCLQRADNALVATFAKLGSVCPGDAAQVGGEVVTCVNTLLTDVPNGGECASASTSAVGKAVSLDGGCAANDATRPGTFWNCATKMEAKLPAALHKAGDCAQAGVGADVHTCGISIRDSIAR